MKIRPYVRLFLVLLLLPKRSLAQSDSLSPTGVAGASSVSNQRDVLYYVERGFPFVHFKNQDSSALKAGKIFTLLLPSISYEPHTRLAVYVGGTIAYQAPEANVSTLVPALLYSQNHQLVFHSLFNIWLPHNRFNLTADWRMLHYPQLTYGLGGHTSVENAVLINYDYLRLYLVLSKRIAPDTYLGGGYSLDYHWNIRPGSTSGHWPDTYGYNLHTLQRSTSSGLTLNFLYDGRANSINPTASFYANLVLRSNLVWLGSDTNYPSLLVDVRKYVNWPLQSSNILAFWSYNVLTLSGSPPYLDLPSTNWDTYNNTGRGYIQGRYRGKSMLYGEMEYRFGLLTNGLLGGVVFANVQTVTEPVTNQFDKLLPAGGLGLRIKINKVSALNLALDYGFGLNGSRGLFFNIGEVF